MLIALDSNYITLSLEILTEHIVVQLFDPKSRERIGAEVGNAILTGRPHSNRNWLEALPSLYRRRFEESGL